MTTTPPSPTVASRRRLCRSPTANVSDMFPAVGWFDLQGVVTRMKERMASLDHMFDSVIDRSRKTAKGEGGSGESRDFLQLLLQLTESGDHKAPLTENNVKGLLMERIIIIKRWFQLCCSWVKNMNYISSFRCLRG